MRAGASCALLTAVVQCLEQRPTTQSWLESMRALFSDRAPAWNRAERWSSEILKPTKIGWKFWASVGFFVEKVPGFFQVLKGTSQKSKEGSALDDHQGLSLVQSQG